ncbi:MAG: tetratricopeptide repeat protein [Nitrospirota bacterium]
MKNRKSKSLTTKTKPRLFYNPIIHILLVVTFSLIAYSNTFHVPFQFDDLREILGNHIVKNLKYFINLSTHSTRYIGYFTFALNYALHGTNVAGYHIFNFAIHIANALLLYWLIVLSFRTPVLKESSLKDSSKLIALFSALFFACHPVQTQAVTYIVQRLASLATLFYLFSIISYSKARLSLQEVQSKTKSLLWFILSFCSAVLAMKTKEISFTLPVVIILYEFVFFKAKFKRRILYISTLLLTMLIIPLSLIGISKPLGDIIGDVSEVTRLHTNISRWDYLFTQFRVINTYIRLIFLPINQNLIYDYPIYHSFFDLRVFLSFLFLLSILILGIYLFYRYRKTAPHTAIISFGIFWFFITLSVESSIIPISDVIYEHRIYLPSIGFFIAFVTFIIGIRNRLKTVMPVIGRTIIPMLIVIAIILSGRTIHRNTIWKDEMTLWSDVVKKSPNKAGPRNNLGIAYDKKGLVDKAIEQYQMALKLNPGFAEAYVNLGIAYESLGSVDKAIEHFQTAIELKPESAKAHNNLGIAYKKTGLIDKAIEHFQMAVKLNPNNSLFLNNLAKAYEMKNKADKSKRNSK